MELTVPKQHFIYFFIQIKGRHLAELERCISHISTDLKVLL